MIESAAWITLGGFSLSDKTDSQKIKKTDMEYDTRFLDLHDTL